MVDLYPYQERVLQTLFKEKKNVILVSPTGSGKTLAALLPFLQNRIYNDGLLPEKALYVVPMRVLATQFMATFKDLQEKEFAPGVFNELEVWYKQCGQELQALQTGESPEDPQFESMVVACTIDQLLASALGVPYGLAHGAANINVGAVCSSYLILDEPHLYPLADERRDYRGALTTCLELLRQLKGLNRFIFMSATMSGELIDRLSILLDAKVVTVEDDELATINRERVRTLERAASEMSAEQILAAHDRCSLVVCNTVHQAQKIFLELDDLCIQQGLEIDIKLLHSRFSDEDRRKQGQELPDLLGKEQWKKGIYQGKNVIVVATQVVEVGLDISVQVLHTQLAPANSLIQRAGRCARFEQQQGRVIVYPFALKDGKPQSSLPYDTALCTKTWEELAQFEGRPMGFREEQTLVNLVHTANDLDLLQRYEKHRCDLQDALSTSLQTHALGATTDLIRDVTQLQVLIHNNPEDEIKTEPWRWQSFNLHPSQFMGQHWEDLRAMQNELQLSWVCKRAVLTQEAWDDEKQEADTHQLATYDWETIRSQASIPGSLMLAFPQQLLTYDSILGLIFLDGRLTLPARWQTRLKDQKYQSMPPPSKKWSGTTDQATTMQSYQKHIGGLANAYHQGIFHELGYVLAHLEDLLQLEAGTIDRAIQLAIAAHDLGKLNQGWQAWSREWQRLYMQKTNWEAHYQEPDETFFFAKTNYNYRSKDERIWKKDIKVAHPHHACESVRIAEDLIAASLDITDENSPNLPVLRAVCYAIAHHHTPTAHEYGPVTVSPSALSSIEQAFELVRKNEPWKYDLQLLDLHFEKGDHDPLNSSTQNAERVMTWPDLASSSEARLETWLAYIVTRALRLADQRADRYAPTYIL